MLRSQGVLYAYNNYAAGLSELWNSSSVASFCASTFALPTVVNGSVYIPTYALTSASTCPLKASTPPRPALSCCAGKALRPVSSLCNRPGRGPASARRRPARSGKLRKGTYFMIIYNIRRSIALALCAGVATVTAWAGPVTFRVVTVMNRYNSPFGIVEGSPGTFYFKSGYCAVFSVTTQGTKTFLTSFPSGYTAQSQVVSAADGRFYSDAEYTDLPSYIFSVTSTPGRQVHRAQDYAGFLAQNLPDGTLVGIGGSTQTFQTYLIKADLGGVVTPIYQFPPSDRLPPNVLYGRDGNYYGVYYLSDGSGYAYQLNPSGSLTTLFNFPSGSFVGNPGIIPILQGTDGSLYGTTPNGGTNGTGTIYKLTLAGQYTLLYTFPKNKTSYPTELIEGSDGNLYGATLGLIADGGSSLLFRITTSGQYTPLIEMNFGAQGGCPCRLTQGSDGNIYGTALSGGSTGGGVVFALEAGLPKPAPHPLQFQPQSGPVGTKVRIWGADLLSASVAFNGVPTTIVSNSGPNYVFATVPPGATTGPIAVTTPGGTSSAPGSFTVQ